jgi:hypothetical protein
MFQNRFRNGLPKCKVAHSIRQSFLHKGYNKSGIYSNISENYPLRYRYLQKGHIISFYYNKNNLIEYYIHSRERNKFYVVPLYNYLKNTYELVLSPLEYDFMNPDTVYVVRAPNRRIYMDSKGTIANVSKGTILYQLDNNLKYLLRSMPIANSFVLVIMNDGKDIITHVIDLIKEEIHVRRYQTEMIMDYIISLSEKNHKHYKELKYMKIFDKLSFDVILINSIDNSTPNLVFYDKCIFNITLSFENTKTRNKKTLKNALSIVCVFQNNELTVSLQINSSIKIETHSYDLDIDFGNVTVLISDKYKIDSKYNISQSHLYTVIASIDKHTIIGEPNISLGRVVLYRKNEKSFISSSKYLNMNNFGGILFVRVFNKLFAYIRKDLVAKISKIGRYYIEIENEIDHINIIENKTIRELLLDKISEGNNKDWVVMELTDIVKRINLKDRLKKEIRRYVCSNNNFVFVLYAYYIDYEAEEFYALVYFQCVEQVEGDDAALGKYRIYLFRDKIEQLFSNYDSLRLVWKFETNEPPKDIPIILHTKVIDGDKVNVYTMLLRLLNNKWNTGNGFIDMKVFQIYGKPDAYYDYKHNRRSITVSPTNTSFASTLHLVRRIKEILLRTTQP